MGRAAVAGRCGTTGPTPGLDAALPNGNGPSRALADWPHALKTAPARYSQLCLAITQRQ